MSCTAKTKTSDASSSDLSNECTFHSGRFPLGSECPRCRAGEAADPLPDLALTGAFEQRTEFEVTHSTDDALAELLALKKDPLEREALDREFRHWLKFGGGVFLVSNAADTITLTYTHPNDSSDPSNPNK